MLERFFDETGGMQLVLHSPYGGRINRALGLALRKKFCRTFNFELQAAATDDAIVLSLGPHHSFPLEEVPALRHEQHGRGHAASRRSSTRRCSRPAGAGTSTARCSCCASAAAGATRRRSSAWRPTTSWPRCSRRPRPARRTSPGRSRSPTTCSCARRSTTRCTRRSTSTALRALLERIEAGEVTVHCVDTTEPSVLAHEILTARPYAFLDDEELQNRRTNAVHAAARAQTSTSRRSARSSPTRSSRCTTRSRPSPTTADDLHDLLARSSSPALATTGGRCATSCATAVAASVLEHDGDDAVVHDRARRRRAASLRRGRRRRGRRGAARPPRDLAASPPSSVSPRPRRFADRRVSPSGSPCSSTSGFALQGRYTAGATTPSGWRAGCSPACTRTRAAPGADGVEPATAQDFMRFLLRWQHVAPGTQLAGEAGLLAVVDQLQGFEAAAVAWEPELLAAGCARYEPACSTGSATTARSAGCGSPAPCARRRRARRWRRRRPRRSRSCSAPTRLAARGRAGRRRSRRAGGRRDRRDRSRCCASAARASPPSSARRPTGCPRTSSAACGTASPAGCSRPTASARSAPACPAASARTERPPVLAPRCGGPARHRGGRSLVAGARHEAVSLSELGGIDRDELAEAVAELLLRRWGVVFRDLAVHDSLRFPWRDLQWALRRLEDRGLVRGGRFVTGFTGEQYALPEAARAAHADPQGSPHR